MSEFGVLQQSKWGQPNLPDFGRNSLVRVYVNGKLVKEYEPTGDEDIRRMQEASVKGNATRKQLRGQAMSSKRDIDKPSENVDSLWVGVPPMS